MVELQFNIFFYLWALYFMFSRSPILKFNYFLLVLTLEFLFQTIYILLLIIMYVYDLYRLGIAMRPMDYIFI